MILRALASACVAILLAAGPVAAQTSTILRNPTNTAPFGTTANPIVIGATVLGAPADSACAVDNGTCSIAALLKLSNQRLTTLDGRVDGLEALVTTLNGKIDTVITNTDRTADVVESSTPSTVNLTQLGGSAVATGSGVLGATTLRVVLPTDQPNVAVTDAASGSTGAAKPAKASYMGAQSGTNLVGVIQASAHASLKITTATTTQVLALSGSTATYITYVKIRAGGAANVNLVYGTGTNCGTGTTDLYPAEPLSASDGWVGGSGLGPILFAPAGQAVCLKSDAAQPVSVLLAYTQF